MYYASNQKERKRKKDSILHLNIFVQKDLRTSSGFNVKIKRYIKNDLTKKENKLDQDSYK